MIRSLITRTRTALDDEDVVGFFLYDGERTDTIGVQFFTVQFVPILDENPIPDVKGRIHPDFVVTNFVRSMVADRILKSGHPILIQVSARE